GLHARARELRRARRRPARGVRGARAVDVLGDARGAAAARQRCRNPPAGAHRRALAPRARAGRLAGRVLVAGVRLRRVGRVRAPRRRRALDGRREHAAEFVARTAARVREAACGLDGGGLAVCALDTELLGHWWYEGVAWLEAVVAECDRQGLALLHLDDAIERFQPVPDERVSERR